MQELLPDNNTRQQYTMWFTQYIVYFSHFIILLPNFSLKLHLLSTVKKQKSLLTVPYTILAFVEIQIG